LLDICLKNCKTNKSLKLFVNLGMIEDENDEFSNLSQHLFEIITILWLYIVDIFGFGCGTKKFVLNNFGKRYQNVVI